MAGEQHADAGQLSVGAEILQLLRGLILLLRAVGHDPEASAADERPADDVLPRPASESGVGVGHVPDNKRDEVAYYGRNEPDNKQWGKAGYDRNRQCLIPPKLSHGNVSDRTMTLKPNLYAK